MKTVLVAAVCCIIVFLAMKYVFPDEPQTIIRTVTVQLSKADLDSMELSWKASFKVPTKTKLVSRNVVDTSMAPLLRQAMAERESLKALLRNNPQFQASETMTIDTTIGKYRDSLKVVADCLNDSIGISFRANPREVTKTDTLTVSNGSFWNDLMWFTAGAGAKTLLDGLTGR